MCGLILPILLQHRYSLFLAQPFQFGSSQPQVLLKVACHARAQRSDRFWFPPPREAPAIVSPLRQLTAVNTRPELIRGDLQLLDEDVAPLLRVINRGAVDRVRAPGPQYHAAGRG